MFCKSVKLFAQKKQVFYFLFDNHEDSIKLYLQSLGGKKLGETEGIDENELALNRRILKLALEQTCDVDYTLEIESNHAIVNQYKDKVEDLLFLGEKLYGFAEHLAENRMIEDCNRVFFDSKKSLQIERKHYFEHIYKRMNAIFQAGFKEGIMDNEVVKELRGILQKCMNINYDFAGSLIFQIKNHHRPGYKYQTVEPAILPQNLTHNGVDKDTATDFS